MRRFALSLMLSMALAAPAAADPVAFVSESKAVNAKSGSFYAFVERTQGRQTPWLARNRMIGDFSLF